MTARVAVLASGGGSNLQAILDYFAEIGPRAAGRVAVVISDRAGAGALDRARRAGIPAVHIPSASLEHELPAVLAAHHIDVIALAGFLKFVPVAVVRAYAGRMINVHPALLPKFGGPGMYGHHVHDAVIAAQEKESGATVHFVDEIYDHGGIIESKRVEVVRGETSSSLAAKVLEAEHWLYPRVLQKLCEERGANSGGRGK